MAFPVKVKSVSGVLEDHKFQITNHKYQTNHNNQSASGGPNLSCVLDIEYWNLRFVYNLVLGVWDFIIQPLYYSSRLTHQGKTLKVPCGASSQNDLIGHVIRVIRKLGLAQPRFA